MQPTEEGRSKKAKNNGLDLFALLPAAPAFQEGTPTRAAVCWLAHQMDDQGKGYRWRMAMDHLAS